jgi:RNA polymerase sigma factor (sigma-70 family)
MDSNLTPDRTDLQRARDGDLRGFEALYRRRAPIVLSFLARRVEAELAADLFAETFARLFVLVAHDKERPLPDIPLAWLLATSRNLLVDSRRRGHVEEEARHRLAMQPLVLEDADLQRIEDLGQETDVLRELAASLPPDQFQALQARVLEEQEYPTVAQKLGCSEAVVRKRVSRALQTLRRGAKEPTNV